MLKKVLLVLVALLAASIGYAQEVEAPDWEQVGANAVQVLVIPLTVIVIWLARKLIPVIPRAAVHPLAVALGLGLDWLLAFTTGGEFSLVVGALLGAAAVWLREFVNTIKQHGASA